MSGTVGRTAGVVRRTTVVLVLALVVSAIGLGLFRPERAGAALTPGVLNVGATPMSLPIGPPAGSGLGFVQRDAGISAPLSDGRTLWIYADTTQDGVMAILRGTGAIGTPPSPLVVWEPTTLDDGGHAIPASPLINGPLPPCPEGQDQFAWPMSAATVPQGGGVDKVYVYFQSLCGSGLDISTFVTQASGVAEVVYNANQFPSPSGLIAGNVLNAYLFPPANGRTPKPMGYGAASAYKDGYLYVWQCDYSTFPGNCTVGRTTPAGVATSAAYTFWNGGAWVAGANNAAVLALPGGQTGYFKPSIGYVPGLGVWVWADGDFPQTAAFVRTAPNPYGPWSAATRIPIPECSGWNCRAVELHEQLSSGTSLALSFIDVSKLPQHRFLSIPVSAIPFGSLESAVVTGPGTVQVAGWGIDPDTASALSVHVYVDGAPAAVLTANQARPDVGAAFPAYGSNHGYTGSVPVGPGDHTVCVYGINVGPGSNGTLGCRAVSDPRPVGAFDTALGSSPTAVTVTGWALDPDTASSIDVAVTLDGGPPTLVTANLSRPDVGAAYPGFGNLHGFSLAVPVSSAVHQLCVTAKNVGAGSGDTDLGCRNASPLPGAPTSPSAVAGVEEATVSWVAPAGTGGLPIDAYLVTIQPGGGVVVVPGGQTSAVVTGLTGGTGVSFTVAARTTAGTGPASAATALVTPSAAPGAGFHAVTPFRVLDSRGALGGWNGVALGPGEQRDVVVAPSGGGGGVPASARAVVLNVTATGGTAASYLTAFPAGAVPPTAANLLFAPGQTVPNLVTAKVGAGGKVSLFNQLGSVHVIVDVVGWYDDGSSPGDRFSGLTPARVLDTRNGTGGAAAPIGPGGTRNLTVRGAGGVPMGANAVVLNVTVTGGSAASYLQVAPAGAGGGATANLLFGAGQTVPNLVVVGVGTAGQVSFFNQLGSVHVIADVLGYFDAAPSGGLFHALSPTRLLDSRGATGGWAGVKLGANQSRGLLVTGGAVPGGATGIVLNTTVTGGSAPSYLSVSPAPGPVPAPTANLLFAAGQTVPNAVVVRVPPSGQVDVYNQQGSVHVIADAAGWFGP